MSDARLYYEAHITVDAGDDWQHFIETVPSSYRCSKFDEDQVDNYHGKWFCSARGTALEDFKGDLSETINTLTENGYNVIRWKIEDTLLDSKHGDVLD